MDREALNNRSNQMNPNNNAFWKSRGFPDRPINWDCFARKSGSAATSSNTSNSPDSRLNDFMVGAAIGATFVGAGMFLSKLLSKEGKK